MKRPVGVCGLITPWNFPGLMSIFKIAPTLASGSTCVLKPAEITPLSAIKFTEIWHNLEGAPPGVINVVPGMGDIAGEALVDNKDVAKISFTGSTAIGKRIMQRSGNTLKRLTLELGGKSPLIVFKDGDIDKAVSKAF